MLTAVWAFGPVVQLINVVDDLAVGGCRGAAGRPGHVCSGPKKNTPWVWYVGMVLAPLGQGDGADQAITKLRSKAPGFSHGDIRRQVPGNFAVEPLPMVCPRIR